MKKDDKVVDLEYMIPKEFKEDKVDEPVPKEPIQTQVESCHSCGRSSHDAMLTRAIHYGQTKLVCPRCLKRAMDSDSESSLYGSSSTPSYSRGTKDYSSGNSENSSGSMSMFD